MFENSRYSLKQNQKIDELNIDAFSVMHFIIGWLSLNLFIFSS